ncbi:uncharacterized protein LOC107426542 isoform X1 [Ziziphus jujuba]|uniref:HVA22-like protein n=1 Tax=Ziziphus jujuba TaxID=326968 RepID=A0A6P4ASR8_ZIZJJ|nr:uncharacterized protein LOC107426542 isoform X1 [Ziziphus jujuba]
MGFVGLVQFAVKYFVNALAWPLFALGYPLCASIRAIENNSVSDTQKLNTYWVVFSLILLLEHVLNLLEWLLLWPYIRLMIVCWLVTPYFDGAFYVYENLIRPCLSMDLQNVINWFNKRMESLYAKDNFLTELEKFIKENEPEALEKIIAGKLNSERPTVTQKDIRPLEVLEKNEVKAFKKMMDGGVQPNVTRVEYRNFAGPEIKKPVPEAATTQREFPETPSSSKGQKWTCEICNITMQDVTTFNIHLQGQEHKVAVVALKAKYRASGPRVAPTDIPNNSNVPNVEPGKSGPQIEYPGNAEVRGQQQGIPASVPRKSVEAQQPKKPNIGSLGIDKSSLWCSICNVKCTGESNIVSHLGGRRHLAALQQLST